MKFLIAPLLLVTFPIYAGVHCQVPTMPVYDPKLRMTVCKDPSVEESEEEAKLHEACAMLKQIRYLSTESFFNPDPSENEPRVKQLKIDLAILRKELPKHLEKECGHE